MAGQKNVLLVQVEADLYGSSRSLLRLVSGLDPRAFRVVVAVGGDGPLAPRLRAAGAKVIALPRVGALRRGELRSWRALRLPWDVALAARALRRIIRSEGIDLVHSNNSVIVAAALAARAAGVPHVFHVREIYSEFPRFWKWYRRFLAWGAQEIICNSAAVAAQFAGQRPVQVIANGLDVEREFRPTAGAGEAGASGSDNGLRVGCVGRIKWGRKGQEVLLRALGRLVERGLPLRALIVGSPFPGNESHLERLKELAVALGLGGQVAFVEERDDIWPLYARMDVFVLPSILPEGLGNVVIEAMAMGLPVVASRCGGVVDLIEDGKSGLLFAPGSDAELAERLAELAGQPQRRREIGEAGRRRQRQEFSLQRHVERIEAVYRRVLGARGGGGEG